MKNEVQALITQAVKMEIGSGIAAAWGSLDDLRSGAVMQAFAGRESALSLSASVNASTVFDLASLTKVLATTSLLMRLVEQGRVDLHAKYPGRDFTFFQLLTHSSGLPAWQAFYESMIARFGPAAEMVKVPLSERKKYFYELVNRVREERAPGEKIVYSDVGFLLLSEYVESLESGLYFCDWVKEEVWDAIPGCGLHFRPPVPGVHSCVGIAATEICPWRGWLQGEVHDDNAWSMGGVAGHAGVFGSLSDVLAWTRVLISGAMVSFATLERFSRVWSDGVGGRRALGFDVPSLDGSGSTATVFSPGSIGHLGFTGTSLWMDLDENCFAVLLTNRVHPSRDDIRIRELRRTFHQVAFGR